MDTKLTPRNLLRAAESGEVEEVMKLLNLSSSDQSELGEHRAPRRLGERRLPNNVRDTNKWTALHLAVEEKNIVALKTLVFAGADKNLLILENYTPFQLAEQNDSSCVSGRIQLGADINCVNGDGRTALMLAARNGEKDCLQFLIKAGADLNLRQVNDSGDFLGPTALMLAAQRPEVDCLQLLLEAGADVNVKTSDGETALMFAAKDGGIKCLELLLEAGADVKVKAPGGETALMFAAERLRIRFLKLLLQAGADVNVKTVDGKTALHFACKRPHGFKDSEVCECIRILIDSGSDVKATDTKGQTVLMYAVQDNCKDYLLFSLVEAGALVDQQDSNGMTALTHAVSKRNHECVRWLIDHGASVHIRDYSGKTLLHYLMSGNDNNSNAERCLEILLSKQLDVNATDKDGMTPLMCWARESEGETATTIDMLIEHGADLNLVDYQGQTALIHSLRLDCSELDKLYPWGHRVNPTHNFAFLLNKGANLSVGKIASGKLSRLSLLDHDLDLLKLQIGCTVDLKATWEQFVKVFGNNKRRNLQFLIINGVMPSHLRLRYRPRRLDRLITTSLLESAVERADYGVIRYLIAICFLHVNDLTFSTDKFKYEHMFFKVMNNEVMINLRTQPWPLVKLCFVAVSTAFGASPGRQERVKNSLLPPKLQRMLLFQEPSSRLCVYQWDKIPLTFSPEEYEKLPRPRPLLYHWPVGRALVPCDCGQCDGTMYKYEGNE